jgi:DNA replication licensing factor MCM3
MGIVGAVDLVLEDDLVDLCKPGDRVAIVGMYKAMPVSTQGSTSGIFRTLIVGTNVRQLTAEVTQPTFSQEDMKNIRRMIKRKDLFEVIADSLAPSIYGHDQIKKALTLQVSGDPSTSIRHSSNFLPTSCV